MIAFLFSGLLLPIFARMIKLRHSVEGMVKLSQTDLSIVPATAYRWEFNADATVWTFHLRKGVKFHDDACFADGITLFDRK